jgi:hypothetical protein
MVNILKKKIIFLISACSSYNKTKYVVKQANHRDTFTYYPFLSGDVFRRASDHVVDDLHLPFYPRRVKERDVLFVKTKYLPRFIKHMHPHIQQPYILITHNGDEEIDTSYCHFLQDDKLLMWFAMNATVPHPKLIPIPIGFGNANTGSQSVEAILEVMKEPAEEKQELLYLNFSVHTHPERAIVKRFFSEKSFCRIDAPQPLHTYLYKTRVSKFTVSPRGNGIDCHRVWESMLVGTIPILKTSPLDPLYRDLPVLIVNQWEEVTESFLETQYQHLTTQSYKLDKLYADYWLKLIDVYRKSSYSPEAMHSTSYLPRVLGCMASYNDGFLMRCNSFSSLGTSSLKERSGFTG